MRKKEKDPPPVAPAAPFNTPFAGLAGKLGGSPPHAGARAPSSSAAATPAAGPATAPPAAPPAPAGTPAGSVSTPAGKPARPPPARAVVRLERAGRRGKTVTVIEKLGLPPAELAAWLGDLKRSLGCGGAVEGEALVLQGDLRERAGKRLEARGVSKVTVA